MPTKARPENKKSAKIGTTRLGLEFVPSLHSFCKDNSSLVDEFESKYAFNVRYNYFYTDPEAGHGSIDKFVQTRVGGFSRCET